MSDDAENTDPLSEFVQELERGEHRRPVLRRMLERVVNQVDVSAKRVVTATRVETAASVFAETRMGLVQLQGEVARLRDVQFWRAEQERLENLHGLIQEGIDLLDLVVDQELELGIDCGTRLESLVAQLRAWLYDDWRRWAEREAERDLHREDEESDSADDDSKAHQVDPVSKVIAHSGRRALLCCLPRSTEAGVQTRDAVARCREDLGTHPDRHLKALRNVRLAENPTKGRWRRTKDGDQVVDELSI